MVRCMDGTGSPPVEPEPLSCPPTWPAVGVVMIQDQPPAPPSVYVYHVSRPFGRRDVIQRKGNLEPAKKCPEYPHSAPLHS